MDNELFSYLDGEVPVYWYDRITDRNTGDPNSVHLELYTSAGCCSDVHCSTCPVHFACKEELSNLDILRRLCPHIANDYPNFLSKGIQ